MKLKISYTIKNILLLQLFEIIPNHHLISNSTRISHMNKLFKRGY